MYIEAGCSLTSCCNEFMSADNRHNYYGNCTHIHTHTHKHSEENGFFQSSCFSAPSPGLLCLSGLSQLVAGFRPPCQAAAGGHPPWPAPSSGLCIQGQHCSQSAALRQMHQSCVYIFRLQNGSAVQWEVGEMTMHPSIGRSEEADCN